MRKLFLLAVVVAVLGLVSDVGLKALAESQVERTAKQEAPGSSANAAIPVFPFLPPLLLSGKVNEVSVHLVHVPAGPTFFDRLDFDLHGVRIDRHALLAERRVKLVGIERGTVSAEVQLPTIARNLPLAAVTARVVGRAIVVRGPGGVAVSIPMPAAGLVPCQGNARLQAGAVRVTCTLTNIPPALVEAINQSGALAS
ncbi:MAG: hypothetical protein QOJ09_2637 [Actinomycetota bacterium]|nr:hypothetical protein [Actinomycetota bacterium]